MLVPRTINNMVAESDQAGRWCSMPIALRNENSMKTISVLVCVFLGILVTVIRADPAPLYRDPAQPIDKRVDDLISRMTIEEKATELDHKASGIARLGIPQWGGWNQCLHGIWSRSRTTTLFPVSIAMAATWDPALVHEEANAISDEARAMYNIHEQGPSTPCGLVYRGPVINMSRNPLWGRIQECYGEDPYLTCRIAVAYVEGLQGNDPKYMKIAATLKHYAVNNVEKNRLSLSASVSDRMLHEYWLPQFRDCCEEAHAASMMAAYNSINGVPCIANPLLLTDIPRTQWGWDGFIVCDLGGIKHLVDGHHLTDDMTAAVADALNAGCDYDDAEYRENISKAIERKLVTEETVNRALARVLKVGFRLGVFDPPDSVPFSKIPESVIDSPEHRALALKAARESIVLLTNNGNFLPLDKSKLKTVAVIGPAATMPEYGNYYHYNKEQHRIAPLEGLKNRLGSGIVIRSAAGCDITGKIEPVEFARAVDTAKGADVAVVFVGTNLKVEAEDRDRRNLFLPGGQEKLIEAVFAANPKTVVVLMNAGPESTKWARDHVPAMLEAWYAGEEGGNAIADVLLGNFNPAGRLPYTVYQDTAQIPPDTDYDITDGYTYMYFTGEAVFPFGHGLSYSSFNYGKLTLSSPTTTANRSITISLDVTNTGQRPGEEVVQFYGHEQKCSVKQPNEKLVGFERLHLSPGETKTVTLNLPADRMHIYDQGRRQFVVEPGTFDIMAGSSSKDIRSKSQYQVTK
jgi:beta-glucosidase